MSAMRRSMAWLGLLLLVGQELQAQDLPAKPTAQQLKAAKEAFAKIGVGYTGMGNPLTEETDRVFYLQEGMTDAVLKRLPNPPFPFALDLSYSQVTAAGLKELKGLKALTTLHLSGKQVTS